MKNIKIRKPQINHVNRTVTITDTFQRAAAEYGTEAYKILMDIKADCPGYSIVHATHRKRAKDKSRVTYEMMKRYIACLRDGEYYLEVFDKVRELAKAYPNSYRPVYDWFYASFPDYGKIPEFDAEGYPIVRANLVSFEAYKEQREAKPEQEQAI